jgi:hypothetical protein
MSQERGILHLCQSSDRNAINVIRSIGLMTPRIDAIKYLANTSPLWYFLMLRQHGHLCESEYVPICIAGE